MKIAVKANLPSEYSCIIRFFMDAYVAVYTYGRADQRFQTLIATPILPEDETVVNQFFLDVAKLLDSAQPPDVFQILLQTELNIVFSGERVSREQVRKITLISEMMRCFYVEDIGSFLNTKNLWPVSLEEYTYRGFYPSLPEDIRKKYLPFI